MHLSHALEPGFNALLAILTLKFIHWTNLKENESTVKVSALQAKGEAVITHSILMAPWEGESVQGALKGDHLALGKTGDVQFLGTLSLASFLFTDLTQGPT